MAAWQRLYTKKRVAFSTAAPKIGAERPWALALRKGGRWEGSRDAYAVQALHALMADSVLETVKGSLELWWPVGRLRLEADLD